jgi:hypothetical protein
LRVLPIQIDSIEAVVFDHIDAAVRKSLSTCRSRGRTIHVFVRVCISPASYTKQDLKVTVGLLEKIHLFDSTVDIVARV